MLTFWKVPDSYLVPGSAQRRWWQAKGKQELWQKSFHWTMWKYLSIKMLRNRCGHIECLKNNLYIHSGIKRWWQFFIEHYLLICVRNYRIWEGNNWLRCRRLVDAKTTGQKILGEQDISQDPTVSPYLLLSNCKGRECPLQQRNLANTTLTQGSNLAPWWQARQSLPLQQSWQQHLVWLYMKRSLSSRLWDVLEASGPGSHLTLLGSIDIPSSELCLVPGPVLVLEMQRCHLGFQGWKWCSGVCSWDLRCLGHLQMIATSPPKS